MLRGPSEPAEQRSLRADRLRAVDLRHRTVIGHIESVARTLGTGTKTSMVVVGDATWPISWYLRDYPVHWNSLPQETNAPILIVDPTDATRLQKDLGDRYTSKRFAVRGWWQVEWEKMTAKNLLRFLMFRRAGTPPAPPMRCCSSPRISPRERSCLTWRCARRHPRARYSAAATRGGGRVLGTRGAARPVRRAARRRIRRRRQRPRRRHRKQPDPELAPDGKVLGVWGGPGAGPGQFRQPCGVAASSDGSVYVADTWNHRIQKLDRRAGSSSSGARRSPRSGARARWWRRRTARSSSPTRGNKRVARLRSGRPEAALLRREGSGPGSSSSRSASPSIRRAAGALSSPTPATIASNASSSTARSAVRGPRRAGRSSTASRTSGGMRARSGRRIPSTTG